MITLKQNDFESFFDAPFNAYGPDSLYVSPMKSDLKRFLSKTENPLFKGDSDLAYVSRRIFTQRATPPLAPMWPILGILIAPMIVKLPKLY